jgi:hypothetical protein
MADSVQHRVDGGEDVLLSPAEARQAELAQVLLKVADVVLPEGQVVE